MKSTETNWILWAPNDQNHIFLQFYRIIEPLTIVGIYAHMCNSIGRQIGKIAKNKWPSEWTGYTNQDEKERDHIKWKLKRTFWKKTIQLDEIQQNFPLIKMVIFSTLTNSIPYMVRAKKRTLIGRRENIMPLLMSATRSNILEICKSSFLYIYNEKN